MTENDATKLLTKVATQATKIIDENYGGKADVTVSADKDGVSLTIKPRPKDPPPVGFNVEGKK